MSNPLNDRLFPTLDLHFTLVQNSDLLDSLQETINLAQADTSKKGVANLLQGSDGDDQLDGGGKDDVLIGNGGNDDIRGQGGRDVMQGGSGADTVLGQGGDDYFIYRLSDNLDGAADFYDGGGDTQGPEDSIWFMLTYGEYKLHGAEIELYQDALNANNKSHGFRNAFNGFNLVVDDIESAEILLSNRAPTAVSDDFTTDEDTGFTTTDLRDNDTDPDNLDELEIDGFDAVSIDGALVDHIGNGEFSYAPNSQFEYLAVNESTVDTFDYTITDLAGATSTTTVSVLITGVNDVPIVADIDVTGGVTELITPVASISDSGTIEFTDVDLSDTHFIRPVSSASTVLGSITATVSTDTTGSGLGGVISWIYSVPATAVEYLAADQTRMESFVVTLDDGNGGAVSRTVDVTITGTNDLPIVANVDVTGAVTELASSSVGTLSDNGTIAFTDVDLTDSHSILPITASAGALGALSASVASQTTGTGTGGVISWNYTLPNAAVEYLAKDQTKLESFVVTLDDGNGGQVARTVDVTITGTNDLPIVATTDVTGGVTELVTASGNLSDSGAISFTDVDLTDSHSILPIATPSGALGSLTASVSADTTGSGSGGVISWNYSVPASSLEYLAKDQTKVENFVVTLDDGNGGQVSRTVGVTLTGTNDTPIVATTDVTGEVTEMLVPVGSISDNGTISFTDVDLTDTHSIQSITSLSDVLGTLTALVSTDTTGSGNGGVIAWNYSVPAADVEYLNGGQNKIETFTVTLDDGNGGTVTRDIDITIVGTPDIITTSQSFTQNFSAAGQSMWGSGAAFNIEDHRFLGLDDVFNLSINESLSLNVDPHFHEGEPPELEWHGWNPIPHVHDPGSFPSLHFHPVEIIGLDANLNFAIKTGLQSDFVLQGGTINATSGFNIDVETIFNHQTDVLKFNTSATLNSGSFSTFSPSLTYNLDLIFNLNGSASASLDSIAGDADLFDFNINTNNVIDIFDFNSATDAAISYTEPTGILTFDIAFPSVDTTGTNAGGGTFTSTGATNNFLELTLDVDQFVAVAVNVALGNPPTSTINPFDLGFDVLDGALYANLELLDLKLTAGTNFIQNFNMNVSGLGGMVVFTEHATDQTLGFTFGDSFEITNASQHDVNNDGSVDYFILMDPSATLRNDTDLGFNVGYNLDLLKASAGIDTIFYAESVSAGPVYNVGATVPITTVGILDSTFNLDFGAQQSSMLSA